jgi:hypothetical protein
MPSSTSCGSIFGSFFKLSGIVVLLLTLFGLPRHTGEAARGKATKVMRGKRRS